LWRVECDIAPLEAVLVHEPGLEFMWARTTIGDYEPVYPSNERYVKKMKSEHKAFVKTIKENSSAQVFYVEKLIDNFLDEASKNERKSFLREAIGENRLEKLSNLVDIDKVDSSHLIGTVCPWKYIAEDGTTVIRPITSLRFTRDSAATLHGGLVVANFVPGASWYRVEEPELLRAVVTYCSEVKEKVVLFEDFSKKKEMFLQGGDVMPIDEETLAIGAKNRTTMNTIESIAERLFRECDVKTVYAVHQAQCPPEEKAGNLQYIWMHLDTVFNFVDKRKVLTFQNMTRDERLRKVLVKGLETWHKTLFDRAERFTEYPKIKEDLEKFVNGPGQLVNSVRDDISKVTVFRKGQNEHKVEGYFLDVLVKDDKIDQDGIITVAGDPDDYKDEYEYAAIAISEEVTQASNVLTLRPGTVVGYDANVRTIKALRNAGVRVISFPSDELSTIVGGPHCMTMPFSRK